MNREEFKKIRKESGLSRVQFAESIGVSVHTLDSWVSGKRNIPDSTVILINQMKNKDNVPAMSDLDPNPILTTNTNKKVPYYDIDATAHVATSFNDVKESPAFYVDYPPFNDCSAYINCFGDSMFPKYKNGEKLAVKQIRNFDIILWGETYLVVTDSEANDLRTVKDVFAHDDLDKIVLRSSNPSYKGDTVISKKNILSMFAVKGKISQNFN